MPRGVGQVVLPYKNSTGMCRVKAPHFSALAAPKASIFLPGPLQKTSFSKIYNSLYRFSNLGRSKRPSFKKKKEVSLLFLIPKPSVFPVRSLSESPSFLVRDRSLGLPFLNLARHKYTNCGGVGVVRKRLQSSFAKYKRNNNYFQIVTDWQFHQNAPFVKWFE